MIRTAILVDGAFYRKRACNLFGDKRPEERAKELSSYCHRHIKEEKEGATLRLTWEKRMIIFGQMNFLRS